MQSALAWEEFMRVIHHRVASVCYWVGFTVGGLFITMSNALEAGFAAAERRYAKVS
jgi:hypothetical protein